MIAWPSFDGTKLPLSQPARQQLSRIYSDFRNNPAVAERKAGCSDGFNLPPLIASKEFMCLSRRTEAERRMLLGRKI
jgi:hypothetical protein